MSDFRTLPDGMFQQTYVVQKSRFIAFAKRVENTEAAQTFLKDVALPDATHHCYAYITDDAQKSTDNGEPAGTAGIPILQAIKQKQLNNVAIAVERYFGGIKLGTGGLARAYAQAASQVLESVTSVLMRECVIYELTTNYEHQSMMRKLITQYGKELSIDYLDLIRWQVAIPVGMRNTFENQLKELFHNNIILKIKTKQVWVEFQDC